MLSIRLSRTGKRKQPLYRLIITEKSQDPWGTYLENLGTYNPRTNPATINFKVDRIKDWISKGAQCTETVWNILIDQKVVEGEKRKTAKLSIRRKEVMAKKNEEKTAKAEKAAAKAAEAAEAAAAAKAAEAEAAKAAAEAPAESAPVEEPVAAEKPAEETAA
ncbi:MAG: ribosomal protein [Candidatus Parcubacteria bacterium]|jgi:small subunit ribosomal protein S16